MTTTRRQSRSPRHRSADGFSGELLKEARLRSGLTQTKIAELIGVTNSYIAGLERGRKAPGPATLCRLADALDTSPIALLEVGDRGPSITQLRFCAGLEQKDVAREIGCSDMSYSRIERGETPRLDDVTVEQLASVLGAEVGTVRTACQRTGGSAPGPDEKGAQSA